MTIELCHVLTEAAWQVARATGTHAPPELARDGFLHCCTPAQLAFVLQRHFAGVPGLLVLRFTAEHVPALLRWVRSEPDQDPFPHLYGAIPCTAVHDAAPAGG